MKNIKSFLFAIAITGSLISCKSDDNGYSYTPPRDYTEQYANEILEIEEYLDSHYLIVADSYVTVNKIPENGTQQPISERADLQYKIVKKHNVDYKLYYLKFNEGANIKPSHVDSVFVTYKGLTLKGAEFDSATNPTWFKLDEVIEGWSQIMPEFKTGEYNATSNTFSNPGFGLVIIPSGLGYYNASPNPTVGQYASLVFSFNLNTLKYRDHDNDGIPSYLEVENIGDDPRTYDTDGDGIFNYLDIDDDNDGRITKYEIKDENGDQYPFDQIPTCQGGTLKKHLDPSCQ